MASQLEQVRTRFVERVAGAIKSIARAFRIMDDDGNKTISFDEFAKGLRDFGCNFEPSDSKTLFEMFDKDASGQISIDEFLIALQPPISQARLDLIRQTFKRADKTGDGVITVEDLRGYYKASEHPKVQNGEWTEERVFAEFIKVFEDARHKDGKITEQEFIDYYNTLSATIDNDEYFEQMMRNAWKL